jgi:uncharacterized protein
MQMTGEQLLAAPREIVWRSLNDPEILRQCIPGCEAIEKTSDTEFTAKVTLAVGPVKARFNGKVQLLDIDAPNSYRIAGEGQGGVAGFGKGSAVVRLADKDGGTLLAYSAESTVGGKIAQLGARLIDGAAKKRRLRPPQAPRHKWPRRRLRRRSLRARPAKRSGSRPPSGFRR